MSRQDSQQAQANKGDMRRWLALDTSTNSMAVALLEGDKLIAERCSLSERNSSIHLMPVMQELLAEAGWTTHQIERIGVGWGPGSYTGVRIGVTVAKTVAWALGCPLAGVSSLETLAYGARRSLRSVGDAGEASTGPGVAADADGSLHWFAPLMNARRGQVYTGLYELHEGSWRTVEEDGIRDLDAWTGHLCDALARRREEGAAGPATLWMVGETAPFEELLVSAGERLGAGFQVRPLDMSGYDVGLAAQGKPLLTDPDEIHAFVPNYTQLAEAEQKLAAKLKG